MMFIFFVLIYFCESKNLGTKKFQIAKKQITNKTQIPITKKLLIICSSFISQGYYMH